MSDGIFGSPFFASLNRQSGRDTRRQWLVLLVACLLVAFAWFGSLELRGLFIPDEGRYAEIPREMLASGDWVTPHLNDLKYFEKPPLQYWLTAASFRIFGEDEWTARVPAAMLGFLAISMLAFTCVRLKRATTGLLAGIILASSWAFFLGAQYLTLDMTLTAFLTMALCSFLLAQREGASAAQRDRWMLVAWIAAGLAVLSKGLIGIVLPGLAIAAYLALDRDWQLLRRLNFRAGGPAFLLVATPWFIVVQQRNPEFFHFFFIHEHLERFTESGHHRAGPWWYYLPVMIGGLMPWTAAMVRECLDQWRTWTRQRGEFCVERFAGIWAAVTFVFFSLSHSKLPAYVLPAFPALAIVLAAAIQRQPRQTLAWSAWTTLLLAAALLVSIHLLPGSDKFAALGQDAQGAIPWLYAATALLILTAMAAILMVRRAHFATAIGFLVVGTLGCWSLVFEFLHAADESLSSERLIENLTHGQRPFRPGTRFYSVGQFDTSVPFYLGRSLTLVATRGELGPGIDAEPQKVIASMQEFEKIWRTQPTQAYAILQPASLVTLRQHGLPVHEIVSDNRLTVVSRLPK